MPDALQNACFAHAIVDSSFLYLQAADEFMSIIKHQLATMHKPSSDGDAIEQNQDSPNSTDDHVVLAVIRMMNAAHSLNVHDQMTITELANANNAVIEFGDLNPSIEDVVVAAIRLAEKRIKSSTDTANRE
jgi:hypothetical protein